MKKPTKESFSQEDAVWLLLDDMKMSRDMARTKHGIERVGSLRSLAEMHRALAMHFGSRKKL